LAAGKINHLRTFSKEKRQLFRWHETSAHIAQAEIFGILRSKSERRFKFLHFIAKYPPSFLILAAQRTQP
jgi:hypothetical protein